MFVDLQTFAALTSYIDQKVHIKVKAKSQTESNNIANSFELDNGHVTKVQPIDSTGDQSAAFCRIVINIVSFNPPLFSLTFSRVIWPVYLVFKWWRAGLVQRW